MLIATGLVLQERWFTELHDNVLVGVSDSGYMNDQLAYEWIKHSEWLSRPAASEWRLLMCDNYGSHNFYLFLEFSRQH